MPAEVGVGVVRGCVALGPAVELTAMSLTVDDGLVISDSIGKRFLLHLASVQHSATQRAKYTGPGRV